MDELTKALKRVVEDWGIVEIVLFVMFFPFSLLYVLVRYIQEYGTNVDPDENNPRKKCGE